MRYPGRCVESKDRRVRLVATGLDLRPKASIPRDFDLAVEARPKPGSKQFAKLKQDTYLFRDYF